MEKNFKKVAREFLMQVAMEKGKKSNWGMNNGNYVYSFKPNCPLLDDNGEEEKIMINIISAKELAGRERNSVGVTTQDVWYKSVDVCDEEYLRLVIRSVCAAYRDINQMWLKKLSEC